MVSPIKKMDLDYLIGQDVGTATLVGEIARGGMAAVFLAFQRSLKRQIAVKILPKSILSSKASERFQQEAEASAILTHPNIVQIYEVGETDDFLFFTMQLVKGHPLNEVVKAARKHILPSKRILPVDYSIKTIIKVLDALDYAHRQDVIHRDIKPANIILEEERKSPMITDFGLAKVASGLGQDGDMIRGTPVYMAPEQISRRGQEDARADIYSTGAVLFEMLTSRLPLPAFKRGADLLKMKLSLKDGLYTQKPSEMNEMLDRDIDEIVLKAVSFNPEERYSSCREFFEELERYLKDRSLNSKE